jgi:hypothetical protein
MLNQAQKVLADSFLQSFESLIDDRILKIKNIDANYEQKLIKLVVNSKLSAASFTTIQKQFKELLIKDLSIEPTIILNNDVCISLNDLYNLSPYNISKRSGVRDPKGALTLLDVETLAIARRIQDNKFSAKFVKYKNVLIEATNENVIADNKRKQESDVSLGLKKKKIESDTAAKQTRSKGANKTDVIGLNEAATAASKPKKRTVPKKVNLLNNERYLT